VIAYAKRPRKEAPADLIPAVAYYRMSSDKQEASIPAQRSAVETYAEQHGYKIVRAYADEGISGSEADARPQFLRLIRDAQAQGGFEVILCWDQDRFSRFDPLEANHYWFLLRQAGVRIVTVCQGPLDFSDLAGWLTASVTQHGKAQYLKDLSRNILRGRLEKAKQGKWTARQAPYGYARTKGGDLVLGKAKAVETVRWLFETYAGTDTSLADMADRLNKAGIPSPGGKEWGIGGIQPLLHRRAYIGEAHQFKERKGKFFSITQGKVEPRANGAPVNAPQEDWLPVTCPPIIDRELWDRVQAKMTKRRTRTTPHRGGGRALLSGLLHCGHCGRRMIGAQIPRLHSKAKGTNKRDLIYVCSSYSEYGKHKCHRNPIHESAVLGFLIPKICEAILSPANFDRLKVELERQAGRRNKPDHTPLKQVRAAVARLDRDIVAAVRELKRTPDDLYDLAVAHVRELRDQRQCAAVDLEAAEARAKGPRADAAEIVTKAIGRLQTLRDTLTAADPAVAREALNQVCERIDLWFDHIRQTKQVRSRFSKGLVRFRVADLYSPANRPR
jgi:DNA invertase Pin-like site-specific DNA recombinase